MTDEERILLKLTKISDDSDRLQLLAEIDALHDLQREPAESTRLSMLKGLLLDQLGSTEAAIDAYILAREGLVTGSCDWIRCHRSLASLYSRLGKSNEAVLTAHLGLLRPRKNAVPTTLGLLRFACTEIAGFRPTLNEHRLLAKIIEWFGFDTSEGSDAPDLRATVDVIWQLYCRSQEAHRAIKATAKSPDDIIRRIGEIPSGYYQDELLAELTAR